MNITVIRDCVTESGKKVPAGTIVEYLGHVTGGMVQVLLNGVEEVIHPLATKELS